MSRASRFAACMLLWLAWSTRLSGQAAEPVVPAASPAPTVTGQTHGADESLPAQTGAPEKLRQVGADVQAPAPLPQPARLPGIPVISFAQALREARARPQAVLAALASRRRAAAELDAARAQWLPSVSVQGSYGYALDNRLVLPNQPPIDSRSLEVRGNAGVEWRALDLARGQRIEAAEALRDAAAHGAVLSQQQAMATAAELYLFALAAFELVDDAKVALQRRQQQLQAAEALVEAGTRSPVDVQRAQVEVTSAGYMVELRRAERAAHMSALAAALGHEPGAMLQPRDSALVASPASNSGEVAKLARARHPELKAARAQSEAARHARDAASADRWPVLGLALTAQVSHLDVRRGVGIDGLQYGGVASAFLRFSGLDPALWFQASAAAAGASEAEAAQRDVSQRIGAEAVDAFFALRRASLEHQRAVAVLTSAEQARAAQSGRYRAGLASMVELLDAQDLAQQARIRRIEARRDEAVAGVRLLARCGVLGEEN